MTTSQDHEPDHHELEDHDLGLSHDLPVIVERERRSLGRRGLLGIMGGVGAVALVGCAGDSGSSSTSDSSTSDSSTSDSSASDSSASASSASDPSATGGDSAVTASDGEIPEETAGPYPGDGSNGPNVLSESGIVRSDITSSFGSMSGTAEGVPVTVQLKVYDLNGAAVTALPGAALYLWHCTREGGYSLYSEGVTDQNFLRGVQEADADGAMTFTTIFPACYDGRWPHMHFEVYDSLDSATTYTNKLRTSQLAIPAEICEQVYGVAEGYDDSVSSFANVSLDTDGVFSDGYSLQLATVTGSVDEGFTMSLNVPV
jgi:protocatechuate 3,4-dioxygenase beta subunit